MKKLIIFDLDGTVADTSEGLLDTHRHTIREMGLQEPDEADMKPLLSSGLFRTYNVIMGLSEEEIAKRVEEAARFVGLPAELLDKSPFELSGGEQQRIAIARALLNDPQVIIADEPTGNLDNETADGIMKLLTGINEEKGTAIVMVTHNRQIFEKYPGRVMVCKDEVCTEQDPDEAIDLELTI